MTSRRPLVRIDGLTQQLPDGDSVLGFELRLPFWEADGTYSPIDLITPTYALPFWLADGTQQNIGLVPA